MWAILHDLRGRVNMRWDEQGTTHNGRYTVVPRTLIFLTRGEEVLFLRGAPDKRLWAGKLNGIGGHIEPGEDPYAGACREIQEETGLDVRDLLLRAVIHISGRGAPGVMLFVYVGEAPSRDVRSTSEGELVWCPAGALPTSEMLEDLPYLLPRLLARPQDHRLIYGRYVADDAGQMSFLYTQ